MLVNSKDVNLIHNTSYATTSNERPKRHDKGRA